MGVFAKADVEKHAYRQIEESEADTDKRGSGISYSRMVGLVLALFLIAQCAKLGVLYGLYRTRPDGQAVADDKTPWPESCVPTKVRVPKVSELTLEEKIGQMTLVGVLAVGTSNDVTTTGAGGVLSGGGQAPEWGNEAADWADLVDNSMAKALKTRLQIPVLYGIDAVHGHNNVEGATIFPHHIGLGAARNPELVREVGYAAAKEVASTGVRWSFSPAVSVCRDPRWGRCYESFGADTDLVINLTTEVEGWQAKPSSDPTDATSSVKGDILVAGCAKHYLADAAPNAGVNGGDVLLDWEEMRSQHLPPYKAAIDKDVMSVMIGYHIWAGFHMHGHHFLIQRVLKDDLGFKGIVVSDYNAIAWLPGDNGTQARNAINAGLDMVMISDSYKDFIDNLVTEVEEGRVPMERIDDAVTRILRVKEKLGLFENSCAPRQMLKSVGSAEHRAVARKGVRESLVLLRNSVAGSGESLFPLPMGEGKKILVAGSHANDIGLQCGGWTITWQGGIGNITKGTTILEGFLKATAGTGTEFIHKVQPPKHYKCGGEGCDLGIVVVGETPYAESEGDSTALQLDASGQAAIYNVCWEMPCVVVLVTGRPIQMVDFVDKVDVLVAAWLPGTEGDGVGEVLFGDDDFVGRLPMNWFKVASHLTTRGVFQAESLFPYGFGLNKAGEVLTGHD